MRPLLIILLVLSYSCTCYAQKLTGTWLEVMPVNKQIVQGVKLAANGVATPIGLSVLHYERWKQKGKKVIFWGDNFRDTLNIVRCTADSLILGKYGMYQITYVKRIGGVLDSLKIHADLGPLIVRNYRGAYAAEPGHVATCNLELYAQNHSGDGAYSLSITGLPSDGGANVTTGLQFTLRGDATDIDATVLQLIDSVTGKSLYFLRVGNDLEMLNQKLERISSAKKCTLKLDK